MPFAPKEPVELDPPKDDPITKEELAKCDGKCIGQKFLSISLTNHRCAER